MKFYQCPHCHNIIAYVENKGVPVVCCGEKMQEIIPGSVDAAQEKHVPVYHVENNIVHVRIGSVPHPMTKEHHLPWVALETKLGNQRRELMVDSAPEVDFPLLPGDEVVGVYAYCNLHGLWKA